MVAVEYNKSNVKEIILLGCSVKKNRSVKKSLLISGIKWAVATIVLIVLYNWGIYSNIEMGFTQDELTKVLITNAFVLLSAPFSIMSGIYLLRRKIKNVSIDPRRKKVVTICATVGGTVGASIGFVLARTMLPNISHFAMHIVFSVIVVFLMFVFIFCTTVMWYKIYLLKKYCPDIDVKEPKIEIKW